MALEIFRLVGSVFVNTDKANDSLHKTDKNAEGVGTKLLSVTKTAGKFALGVVGAAGAVGAAMVAAAESTREYRNDMAKLETAFKSSGKSGEQAETTYRELNSILGDSGQAVEASNHLARLTNNQEELSKWTNICAGVYGTFGDSLPIENLTEASNETAKTGKITGGLADALNWVGIAEDDFQAKLDSCNSESERATLITETLSDAYKNAGDTFFETNSEVIKANEANERLQASLAEIGKVVEPLVTQGKLFLSEILMKIAPVIQWIGAELLPWLVSSISVLMGWIDTITTKLSESGITFSSVMTTIQTVFQTVLTALLGLWDSIGRPLWEFISQAVGVVAGYFAQKMPEIKEFVRSAFADIQLIWEQHLLPALTAIGDFITNVLAPAFEFVFKYIIAPVIDNVFRGIKNLWEGTLKPVFEGILDFITGVFTLDFTKAFSGLVDAVGGIFNGLINCVKFPINTVISLINSFISGINKLQIPDWVPAIGGKGINIPQIPYLEEGAVLEKGQVGYLEGNGAEAVVPLHNNKKWISAVAQDMEQNGVGGNSEYLKKLLEAFLSFVDYLPEILANNDKEIMINNREFARLVKAVK